MKSIKTSVTFDEDILKRIEDYRRRQKKIPTRSQAVIDLIKKGLKDSSIIIPKRIEESKVISTVIPKDVLDDKKIE